MLDPDIVLAAVVNAISSIPQVTAALGTSTNPQFPSLIVGHTYLYGEENTLMRVINTMPSPSILIAYKDMIGGNFSQSTVWKHRLECWLRPKNASTGQNPSACSPPHLWWLVMNSAVPALGTGTQNLRNARILDSLLPMDAMPSLTHHQDELGADLFCGNIVIPEYGDS